MPAPKVNSAVVRIDLYKDKPVKPKDEAHFFKVIKAAFGQRRKTLSNALSTGFPNVEKEKLIPLAEALYDGGIRLLEITYSADGSVSDEQTAQNIKTLVEHFGDRMYIGAGTVLTKNQVRLTRGCWRGSRRR